MRLRRYGSILAALLVCGLLLAACRPVPTDTPASPAFDPTPLPAASPTPTPLPRGLTICLGQEPTSLYLYASPARSTWSVLEAVYDGPFDTRQFSVQPVILKKLPSLADGDALIRPLAVAAGDEVIDANGSLATLTTGTQVLPSGCYSPGCAVTWDGSSPLEMDQMTVVFELLPDILWSDGAALTAADSEYSFQLAADPDTPASKYVINRTASYRALDALKAEWSGKPGYLPQRFETLFWHPLPRHAWDSLTAAALLDSEEANRHPLGWGAYIVDEWIKGDFLRLRKNPAYFRAAEGLPKFDTLTYRFVGEPADNNVAALLSGDCDIVDQTARLDELLEPIIERERDGELTTYINQGPEWEGLHFGIRPASYDDGYNVFNDRPDFFGDVRTRRAFAYCTDRPWAITDILIDQSIVPAGYLPPSHPLFDPGLQPWPYDPQEGIRLLEEVGWKDLDGDPQTPRQAVGVANVLDFTPLSVTYVTTQATQRREVAEILVDSLAECGIQVDLQYYTPGELFAPGPDGMIFGRKFDLAHYGWETGAQPDCTFYEGDQIPSAENNWLKLNVTGYANPAFDQACQAARAARPEQGAEYIQRQQEVQRLFAGELPAIPLYFRLKMAISRPDLCGMDMDVTARSALWNLEALDYGEGCQP